MLTKLNTSKINLKQFLNNTNFVNYKLMFFNNSNKQYFSNISNYGSMNNTRYSNNSHNNNYYIKNKFKSNNTINATEEKMLYDLKKINYIYITNAPNYWSEDYLQNLFNNLFFNSNSFNYIKKIDNNNNNNISNNNSNNNTYLIKINNNVIDKNKLNKLLDVLQQNGDKNINIKLSNKVNINSPIKDSIVKNINSEDENYCENNNNNNNNDFYTNETFHSQQSVTASSCDSNGDIHRRRLSKLKNIALNNKHLIINNESNDELNNESGFNYLSVIQKNKSVEKLDKDIEETFTYFFNKVKDANSESDIEHLLKIVEYTSRDIMIKNDHESIYKYTLKAMIAANKYNNSLLKELDVIYLIDFCNKLYNLIIKYQKSLTNMSYNELYDKLSSLKDNEYLLTNDEYTRLNNFKNDKFIKSLIEQLYYYSKMIYVFEQENKLKNEKYDEVLEESLLNEGDKDDESEDNKYSSESSNDCEYSNESNNNELSNINDNKINNVKNFENNELSYSYDNINSDNEDLNHNLLHNIRNDEFSSAEETIDNFSYNNEEYSIEKKISNNSYDINNKKYNITSSDETSSSTSSNETSSSTSSDETSSGTSSDETSTGTSSDETHIGLNSGSSSTSSSNSSSTSSSSSSSSSSASSSSSSNSSSEESSDSEINNNNNNNNKQSQTEDYQTNNSEDVNTNNLSNSQEKINMNINNKDNSSINDSESLNSNGINENNEITNKSKDEKAKEYISKLLSLSISDTESSNELNKLIESIEVVSNDNTNKSKSKSKFKSKSDSEQEDTTTEINELSKINNFCKKQKSKIKKQDKNLLKLLYQTDSELINYPFKLEQALEDALFKGYDYEKIFVVNNFIENNKNKAVSLQSNTEMNKYNKLETHKLVFVCSYNFDESILNNHLIRKFISIINSTNNSNDIVIKPISMDYAAYIWFKTDSSYNVFIDSVVNINKTKNSLYICEGAIYDSNEDASKYDDFTKFELVSKRLDLLNKPYYNNNKLYSTLQNEYKQLSYILKERENMIRYKDYTITKNNGVLLYDH